VAGSFRNESKVAYRILKKLKEKGHIVFPVNPGTKEVEGMICYPTVLDIPGPVDVINIVTPPKITEEILKDCKKKGIARSHYPSGLCVWVSEFGQSVDRKAAYAGAFAQVLRNAGIDCYANSRLD
jgi:predicted CoA-binding protein